MNTSKNHSSAIRTALFVCLPLFLSGAHAAAATVTYNFEETGWLNSVDTSENFVGSFSGTPDAQGALSLANLSAFSATLTETNSSNDTKTVATFGSATGTNGLTDFLYDATSNSLNLAAAGSPGAQICLGSAVSAGLCGSIPPPPQPRPGTPPLPPVEGDFVFSVNPDLNALTTTLPTVALVQGPFGNPVPGPSGVPEPASYALCGVALLIVSAVLRFSQKRRTSTLIAGPSRRDHRAPGQLGFDR